MRRLFPSLPLRPYLLNFLLLRLNLAKEGDAPKNLGE